MQYENDTSHGTIKTSISPIKIKASDIGTICGVNRFATSNELLNEYKYQYHKNDKYKKRTNGNVSSSMTNNLINLNNIRKKKQKTEISINELIENPNEYLSQSDGKEASIMENINKEMEIISQSDNLNENKILRSVKQMNNGIILEDSALEVYKKETQLQTISEQVTGKIYFDNFYIVGRCDGLIKRDKVIEIKNRTKKIYNCVFKPEKYQCLTYMEMFNVNKCDLVQHRNGEIKIISINRDSDFFQKEIVSRLQVFVNNVLEL